MLNPTPAQTHFLKLARNHPRAAHKQKADYFPKTKLLECEAADTAVPAVMWYNK